MALSRRGTCRARASINAKVCSATLTALPPRRAHDQSHATLGGGFQVDVVDADSGSANGSELRRFVEQFRR